MASKTRKANRKHGMLDLSKGRVVLVWDDQFLLEYHEESDGLLYLDCRGAQSENDKREAEVWLHTHRLLFVAPTSAPNQFECFVTIGRKDEDGEYMMRKIPSITVLVALLSYGKYGIAFIDGDNHSVVADDLQVQD